MNKQLDKIEVGLVAAEAMYAEFMEATRTGTDEEVPFYKDAYKKVKAAKNALSAMRADT